MLRAYDMMMIFDVAGDADALEAILKRVEAELTRAGGTVENRRMLGRRMFARTLKKKDEGEYVILRVSMDPLRVDGFKTRLKLNTDIFRMQMLRAIDLPTVVRSPQAETVGVGADGEL